MSRGRNFARTPNQKRRSINFPSENTSLAGNRRIAGLSILLAVATVALYIPVFGSPFVVMDDQTYVTGNRHVQEGLNWRTIHWAFTSTETGAYWHPLTWLSHALDCQLFGLNPAGHHFHNVLIHALNVVLLFLLFAWMTKRVGASLLVAALFAVHPLNVESVAWVAERKNVLCTLFFLLAIGAYVRYVRRPHWQRYLAVVGLFAAGLMAKPMITTLPCLLLLLDYWPLNRTPLNRTMLDGGQNGQASASGIMRMGWGRLILEKIPLLLLSAASSRITLFTQGRVELSLAQLPLRFRAENAIVSYGLYLWKMLWPARLAAFYPYPLKIPAWQWLSAVLVLLAGTVLVLIFRRKGYLPVGWFWFLGTLVPALGLVQVWKQAMADRFAYIPLIGIFIMIAWVFDDWAEARRLRTVWRVVPALGVLLALAAVSVRQMGYWGSQYDLWSRALEVEESPFAHSAVGLALVTGGTMSPRDLEDFDTFPKRIDAARQHWERVVEMCREQAHENPYCMPEMATVLNDLASLDQAQNRPDDLQRQRYDEALQIERQMESQDSGAESKKPLATTLTGLGNLDLAGTQMNAARQHYEEALSIDRLLIKEHGKPSLSSMAEALSGLAQINEQQDRADDARQNYEEAANIFRQLAEKDPHSYLPNLAQVLNARAGLDKKQNRMEEARAHYTEALGVYRSLALRDPGRYTEDVTEVETSLAELGN